MKTTKIGGNHLQNSDDFGIYFAKKLDRMFLPWTVNRIQSVSVTSGALRINPLLLVGVLYPN
jgi:hypothetical protein